jgi:uncharacterized protein (TIGR03086 family)
MSVAAADGIPPCSAFGLLERAIAYALGTVGTVTSDVLDAPTPCGEWDLGAVLDHVVDSLGLLCGCLEPADPEPPAGAPARPTTDPAAAFRSRATRLVGALSRGRARPRVVIAGGYPLAVAVVAVTGAVEVTVHAWDIGWATRQPRPIPSGLARGLLEICPALVVDAGCHRLFAAPVPVPSTASAGDRLVAVLGRDPTPRRGDRPRPR